MAESRATDRDLGRPFYRDVLIPRARASEFIAGLVRKNGGILSIGQSCVWVHMSDQMFDVVFEILDNCPVDVKLLHERVKL